MERYLEGFIRKDLEENGADFVVEDLDEIGGLDGLDQLFIKYSK